MKTLFTNPNRSLLWLFLPLLLMSQRASAELEFYVNSYGAGDASWYYDEEGPCIIPGENLIQICVDITPWEVVGYPYSILMGDPGDEELIYCCCDQLYNGLGEAESTDEGYIAGHTVDDDIVCWISGADSGGSAVLKICSRNNSWDGKSLQVNFQDTQVLTAYVYKDNIPTHLGNCDLYTNYYFRLLPFGDPYSFEEYPEYYDFYQGYFTGGGGWYEPMSNQYNMQKSKREQEIPSIYNEIYFVMDPHFEVTIQYEGNEVGFEKVGANEELPEVWSDWCYQNGYDQSKAKDVLYRVTEDIYPSYGESGCIEFYPRYIGGDPVITFADATAKSICVNKWDADGDGELSEIEAGMVQNVGTIFKGTNIKSFDELRYFTSMCSISNQAFYACKSLKSITIPKLVTNIGKQAFYTCYSLNTCNMPSNGMSISEEAFYACTQLSAIDVSLVTYFGTKSFYYCKKLTSVTFSRYLYKISSSTFYATPLNTIKTKRPDPISLPENAFSPSVYNNATLLVPEGSVTAYNAKDYWSKFAHMETFLPSAQLLATSIEPFGSCDLTVRLEDNDNFRGFQMDVTLPADLTLTAVTPVFYSKELYNIVNQEIESAEEGNTYRILCYPKTTYSYNNADPGDLLKLTIQSDGSVDNTVETIKLSHITLTNKQTLASVELEDVTAEIEVGAAPAFVAGDVDMDGRHTAADLVGIINYLMGQVQGVFNARNADADQNGKIDITDVTLTVLKILRSGGRLTAPAHAPAITEDGLCISYGNGLQIEVSGAERFVASQMDITLEEGMRLTNVESMDNHMMDWSQTGENSYRIVSYSFSNESYPNSPLFTLEVEGSGNVTVSDALFVTPDGRTVMMGSVSGETTGIADIAKDNNRPADVYTLSGVLVRSGATSMEGLAPGIYIINGKKVVLK